MDDIDIMELPEIKELFEVALKQFKGDAKPTVTVETTGKKEEAAPES